MNNAIAIHQNQQTMTSTQLASLLGIEKKHVNVKIRDMFSTEIGGGAIESSLDLRGYVDNYSLPSALAGKFIERWTEKSSLHYGVRERAALATIEQLLNIKLIRQHKVGSYFIDGYHVESNTAYEIDESRHKYSVVNDMHRQRIIEAALDCSFVRIAV